MSFDQATKESIQAYVDAHLPAPGWYRDFFDFINDESLAERLAEEFQAARSLYKVFRGMDASDWWLREQVRIQILQYASIYEAVIHHVLFDRLPKDRTVKRLTQFPKLIRFSIPGSQRLALEHVLAHDGKVVIPTYQGRAQLPVTKVRFDDKAKCAATLGFIDETLRDEIIELYSMRNAVHLHAELRKNLQYELDMSRTAYRRLEPFREQVIHQLKARGLVGEGPSDLEVLGDADG